MSLASEELTHRIETLLGPRPDLSMKKMFGGTAFMLGGNMLCGPMKDGSLLVRTGPERYQEALSRPGAGPMVMGERTMGGFVQVDPDSIEDDDSLADWLAFAERFVKTLPPK